jgi:hypothetical protein
VLSDLQRAKARATARGARRPAEELNTAPLADPSTSAAPFRPTRPAPSVERPSSAETRQAAEAASSDEDPLARLRAAKERARRNR